MKQRERNCDQPEPKYGGKTCEEQGLGTNVETQSCSEEPCPGKDEFPEGYLLKVFTGRLCSEFQTLTL